MSTIPTKVLTNAHIVTGCLRGLSEGLKYWRPDEVTQDMIDRLQTSLDDLRVKSGDIADYLFEQVQEGEK
jgi:hypothetical protein